MGGYFVSRKLGRCNEPSHTPPRWLACSHGGWECPERISQGQLANDQGLMSETWACFCSLETSFGGVTIEIRIPRHNILAAMVHVAGGQNAAARCRLSVVYLAMWYRVTGFSIEQFRQSGLTSQDACRWRRGNRDFGARHGDDQEIEG